MRIVVESCPPRNMRYPTLGDYWDGPDGTVEVRVPDFTDPRMSLLVAIHELVEFYLCKDRGISEPDVKAFDESVPDADDPGALPEAPYHREHRFAEGMEKHLAAEFGVDWADYCAACETMWAANFPE